MFSSHKMTRTVENYFQSQSNPNSECLLKKSINLEILEYMLNKLQTQQKKRPLLIEFTVKNICKNIFGRKLKFTTIRGGTD